MDAAIDTTNLSGEFPWYIKLPDDARIMVNKCATQLETWRTEIAKRRKRGITSRQKHLPELQASFDNLKLAFSQAS